MSKIDLSATLEAGSECEGLAGLRFSLSANLVAQSTTLPARRPPIRSAGPPVLGTINLGVVFLQPVRGGQ
jgi:hypothetical protein